MTQVAPRQTTSAKLQATLAALKHAANERRFLEDGTPEYAHAIELEEKLRRDVYELAAAIKEESP